MSNDPAHFELARDTINIRKMLMVDPKGPVVTCVR